MTILYMGYECLTLQELHSMLGKAMMEQPALLELPVWVDGVPPLLRPVKPGKPKASAHGLCLMVHDG